MINSKEKGKRFEREVAFILRANGFEARRGVQYKGDPSAPDVESDFPFHIEAKHTERLNVYEAMKQAERDCGASAPCVVHRRNRSKVYVTLSLADLIRVLR